MTLDRNHQAHPPTILTNKISMGKKAAAEGAFRCGNRDCNVTGRDKVNQVCAACRAVRYCGRKCQGQHWSSRGGNHRAHCKPAPKPNGAPAAASGPASASPRPPRPAATAGGGRDADDPEHQCPICLVNEDDHGQSQCAQCFECGQLYCGECNVRATWDRFPNCPTCRAPFAVAAEVKVARLLRLVGRSPGRHTPVARYNLGMMYAKGTGVPQDYTEAVRLIRLAAAQGYTGAQCNLGTMYQNGTGVPQDYTEAVRLYRLAASQGEAGAQCNLAMMYENGTGLPQDHAEAARLYRRAADQGDATAQSNLGAMYQNGTGVLQDYTEAARLCRRAADKGAATAQYNLAVMYLKGTGVSQDHTKAARLLKLADDQGFRLARDALGHLTAEYPIGTRVQITGLTTAAPLNSRLGTVVRLTKPLIAAGRIAVRIDGQPKSVSLSLANVQRV